LPALDRAAAEIITGSEHMLKAYADKDSLTAAAIVDLNKNVLKNPEFNSDAIDTDMLQRLQAAIDSGDLKVINMHKDKDGPQFLELFTRPTEKVLHELICDLRLVMADW
jgi:hypothetical protein